MFCTAALHRKHVSVCNSRTGLTQRVLAACAAQQHCTESMCLSVATVLISQKGFTGVVAMTQNLLLRGMTHKYRVQCSATARQCARHSVLTLAIAFLLCTAAQMQRADILSCIVMQALGDFSDRPLMVLLLQRCIVVLLLNKCVRYMVRLIRSVVAAD